MSIFYRICPHDAHTCAERGCLTPGYDESTCPKAQPELAATAATRAVARGADLWCHLCMTHVSAPCSGVSCPVKVIVPDPADCIGADRDCVDHGDFSCWTSRTTLRSFEWLPPVERK